MQKPGSETVAEASLAQTLRSQGFRMETSGKWSRCRTLYWGRVVDRNGEEVASSGGGCEDQDTALEHAARRHATLSAMRTHRDGGSGSTKKTLSYDLDLHKIRAKRSLRTA